MIHTIITLYSIHIGEMGSGAKPAMEIYSKLGNRREMKESTTYWNKNTENKLVHVCYLHKAYLYVISTLYKIIALNQFISKEKGIMPFIIRE